MLERQIEKEVFCLLLKLQNAYSPNSSEFKECIKGSYAALQQLASQADGQLSWHRKRLVDSILGDLLLASQRNFLDLETRDDLIYKCEVYKAVCDFNLDKI